LQEGVAQTLRVNCGGGRDFYGRYFKCWVVSEHRTHGVVDITKAIYQSCDVFFYTLAEKLGIDRISKWANLLGLGQKTGIDLPNEVSGVMPSEQWKLRNFKQKWYAGETISVGIGQGAVAVTPMQLARAVGAVTMDGKLQKPHVAFPDELAKYGVQNAAQIQSETMVPIDPQNWETITDAMAQVVEPGVGTAPSAHLNGIDFAGKTGSAQTMSNALAKRLGHKVRDNGWFVGVTPRRNPEIVVTVLLEEGEHGYLAARAAAQVIKAYVEKQRARQNNQNLYRATAAPGMENPPPASAAVMAAVNSPSIPKDEKKALLAEIAQRNTPALARTGSERGTRQDSDWFEMAGFFGEPDPDGHGEALHGARFKLMLSKPRAPVGVAVAR
jgi:penicillin-binding protein 2